MPILPSHIASSSQSTTGLYNPVTGNVLTSSLNPLPTKNEDEKQVVNNKPSITSPFSMPTTPTPITNNNFIIPVKSVTTNLSTVSASILSSSQPASISITTASSSSSSKVNEIVLDKNKHADSLDKQHEKLEQHEKIEQHEKPEDDVMMLISDDDVEADTDKQESEATEISSSNPLRTTTPPQALSPTTSNDSTSITQTPTTVNTNTTSSPPTSPPRELTPDEKHLVYLKKEFESIVSNKEFSKAPSRTTETIIKHIYNDVERGRLPLSSKVFVCKILVDAKSSSFYNVWISNIKGREILEILLREAVEKKENRENLNGILDVSFIFWRFQNDLLL